MSGRQCLSQKVAGLFIVSIHDVYKEGDLHMVRNRLMETLS
jgi:hypothetical protein